MAPIHAELFMNDRLLLSNMDLRMQIHRNSDKFCLTSFATDADYKIQVVNMSWYVKKVEVSKSVHTAIEMALQRNTVKYPLHRVVLSKLHIGQGRHSVHRANSASSSHWMCR